MLLRQVADLLRHRDVEILPVLDLREFRAVNGYEHPTDVRARTLIRTGGDVFPHSAARPEARSITTTRPRTTRPGHPARPVTTTTRR